MLLVGCRTADEGMDGGTRCRVRRGRAQGWPQAMRTVRGASWYQANAASRADAGQDQLRG